MNVAFAIVFAIFVVMMLGLAFVAVRWGVRRDRDARRELAATAEADAEVGTTGTGGARGGGGGRTKSPAPRATPPGPPSGRAHGSGNP